MPTPPQPPERHSTPDTPHKDDAAPESEPLSTWQTPTQVFGQGADRPKTPEDVACPPNVPQAIGRYRVDAILGQGGFGTVYRGHDTLLNRRVAIKVPRRHLDDARRAEFLAEARRLAQLRHPSIVSVHDVGEHEGCCFIVTEFVEGRSLTDLLRQQPFTWQEAVEFVASVADALAHAHARAVIHRDIKPANVMVTREGRPILLDFGLGLTDLETSDDMAIIGTPMYMSPEQVRGQANRVDGRTDIFSLAVVLYELLAGRAPFRAGNTEEVLRKICNEEPQPLRQLNPDLPVPLEQICHRAMAKRQSDRFTTAGDLAAALRSLLTGVGGEKAPSETRRVASASGAPPVDSHVLLARRESSALSSGPSKSASRRRDAERRRVTLVLFAYEPRAMEAGETLDPEVQHELAHEFRTWCAGCIEPFGGQLISGAGPAPIGCFGFPVAHEDSPQRAALTALAFLDQAADWNMRIARSLGAEVVVWAVVHTGDAVAEQGGPDGETAIRVVGDAPLIVSRLESLVEPARVTMTAATEQLLKGRFDVAALGPCRVRGVTQELQLFAVSGARRPSASADTVDPGPRTPLVGRDMELGVLWDRWEQATEQLGQIVLLVGDAGLGKSRLIQELREKLRREESGCDATIIEWRCSPYQQGTGFYPATEYFQRQLGFEHCAAAGERRARMEQYLRELGLDSADDVALLAALLSVPVADSAAAPEWSPQRQKELTENLLRRWLQQLAARRTVLFIVEDLHWVDPSTLELLVQQVEGHGREHVLTIYTFRPEFEPPWKSKPYQTQIALNRLTRRQIGELMKQRLGGRDIPTAIVQQVAERTDGVPLFIEEFTKLMQETGVLESGDDARRAATMSSIPTTLQDLLHARLDRIDSNPGVVQLAAAIGREFSYGLLAAACELPDEELQAELDKLVRAELLFQKGRIPDAEFIFKHALIQDAAYQTLLKKRRQEFHLQIGQALEARFPDVVATQPALLARHFTEARETSQGIDYWLKAGQHSQARFANLEAIGHLQQGLALLATQEASRRRDSLELEFQLRLATVMTMAKGWAFPDVEAVHLRARELCLRIGSAAPLFHVTWGMWAWRLLRAELDRADRLSEEIWALAEARQDPGYVMEGCFAKVCTGLFRGELAKCLEFGPRGMDLYEEQRCRFHASLTGQNSGCTIAAHWGWSMWIAGYPDQALAIGERGVALGRALNDPFSHAFARYHLGCVQQHCRMGSAARESGEATIAIGQEQGFGIWMALGMLCQGSGLLLEGKRLEEGARLIQQGFDNFRGSGAELSLTHYYSVLAESYWASKRLDDALAAVRDGLTLAGRSHERFHEANLYRLRGDLLLDLSPANHAEAEECYQKSMEVARRQGAKSWELRTGMSLGRLWRVHDRSADARAMLAEIYGWFTEGFGTPDLIAARSLLEQL